MGIVNTEWLDCSIIPGVGVRYLGGLFINLLVCVRAVYERGVYERGV